MNKKQIVFIIFAIIILITLICTVFLLKNKNNPNTEEISISDYNPIISEKLNYTLINFYKDKDMIQIAQKYIGKEYGNITYIDRISANKYKLYDLKKPVIIEYIDPYCAACINAIEPVEKIREKYKDIYTFIPITDKLSASEESIFEQNGLTEFYYFDSTETEKINDYHQSAIPFFIFLDETGNIRLIHRGSVSEDILEGLLYIAYEADK